jgi:RAT1-interacting protein
MSMPRINLSNGFESWIKSDETFDGHLDALLATIRTHEESLLEEGAADVKVKADIVTWRGMMTKVRWSLLKSSECRLMGWHQIMTAAFDDYSDFEMNATCYQVCDRRVPPSAHSG